jgi:hypothetical protein
MQLLYVASLKDKVDTSNLKSQNYNGKSTPFAVILEVFGDVLAQHRVESTEH